MSEPNEQEPKVTLPDCNTATIDELADALRELYQSAQLNSVHYSKSSAAFKKAAELLRRIGK